MMHMTFDPFAELDRLAGSGRSRSGLRAMPVDLVKDGDRYILCADLPGADPGSIDIDLDGHLLSIRAERTVAGHEGAAWLTRERPAGTYVRQFTLGDGLDVDGISASYDNGVLSVVIPVSERARPRKIEVDAGGSREAISA